MNESATVFAKNDYIMHWLHFQKIEDSAAVPMQKSASHMR